MNSYQDDFDDQVIETLMMGRNMQNLIPKHCVYQRRMCSRFFNPIGDTFLNVGCKEDPANLGDWRGCINIDAQKYDVHTKTDMEATVNNFVHADYFEYQPEAPVKGIVLGEVLEHCTDEVAFDLVSKMVSELDYGGVLIITVPHDPRSKEKQLEMQGGNEEEFFEVRPGVTSWHSNVWTKEKLTNLFNAFNMQMHYYETAEWMKEHDMYWHFFVAYKEDERKR